MNDPAQEFAERVAAKCFNSHDEFNYGGKESLADLIANELREEGWKPEWMVQEREAGRL
jgi:hypothetical protein